MPSWRNGSIPYWDLLLLAAFGLMDHKACPKHGGGANLHHSLRTCCVGVGQHPIRQFLLTHNGVASWSYVAVVVLQHAHQRFTTCPGNVQCLVAWFLGFYILADGIGVPILALSACLLSLVEVNTFSTSALSTIWVHGIPLTCVA